MDIVVNFNTAYYRKGQIITKRSKIAKHYLATSFFWDFVVVVPYFISKKLNIRYTRPATPRARPRGLQH